MVLIEQAIDELYRYLDEEVDGVNYIDSAKEKLESALDYISCAIASQELVDVLEQLENDSNIESVIHELELINMEI